MNGARPTAATRLLSEDEMPGEGRGHAGPAGQADAKPTAADLERAFQRVQHAIECDVDAVFDATPQPSDGMPLREFFLTFADEHFEEFDWYEAFFLMWVRKFRKIATPAG